MHFSRLSAERRALWLLVLGVALQLVGCATTLQPSDEARIADRTFVITGASSGLGRGVALQLASHGANVVLAARRTELLEELAAEARAAGGSALVVTTDVSKPGDVARLAEAAVERFGRIDVWINNAGVTAIGRFWDIPPEDHARLIDVNLKGLMYGSHAALRQFNIQGEGTLVNIGSALSHVPLANQASYSASKSAVLSLGRALNEELRLSGVETIKVVTVLPWAVDTPVWEHAANYSGRKPRMVAVDDPEQVVAAIVRVSLHPRRELPVGWKARGSRIAHRIFPSLTERIAANVAERQLDVAPPASPSSGALHEPMGTDGRVEGSVRERMEREDAARERDEVVDALP
jgi:short-subunit dehydrogenase